VTSSALLHFFFSRPKWLFQELETRQLLEAAVILNVGSPSTSKENKEEFWENYDAFAIGKRPEFDSFYKYVDPNSGREVLRTAVSLMFRKGQILETAFLQINLKFDLAMVTCDSIRFLETPELVSKHLSQLLRLWSEAGKMKGSFYPSIETDTYDDKYSLLMCLFFNVAPTQNHRNLFLVRNDDKITPLLMAFGPTAVAYCKIQGSIMGDSHDEKLLHSLSAFHDELRRRVCRQTAEHVAATRVDGASSSRIAVTNNSKSKKVARKQRKKEEKQARQQSSQGTASGGGQKAQTNKKRMKKKRGKK